MKDKYYVQCYNEDYLSQWDGFVRSAKNGHFMFLRGYMEYHSDRFKDFSLMIYNETGRLVSVMPANMSDDKIITHGGLTFGGLIFGEKANTVLVLQVFQAVIEFLRCVDGIDSLVYKRIPNFYNALFSEEDLYALFRMDAKLIRRDVSSLIDLKNPGKYSKGRKWSINKAKKLGLKVERIIHLDEFWTLLEDVLRKNHETRPVHSLDEIVDLSDRFSSNIHCYGSRYEGSLVAGVLIYIHKDTVHTQYMANSDQGREMGALDYLIDHLITDEFKERHYFNFGISTTNDGTELNEGLISQKEGFGARAAVQDFYEVSIK